MNDRSTTERDSSPADAAAIAAVVRAGFDTYRDFAPPGWEPPASGWTPAEFEERLSGAGVRGRVAVANGDRIVAFCGWMPAYTLDEARAPIPGLAHLWLLFVDRDWWGTPIASDLMRWATDGMAAAAYADARLWTPIDQARARAFYERHGWRPTGAQEDSEALRLRLLEYRVELG